MSNLIKYPYANIQDKEVFVVDVEARASRFSPLKDKKEVLSEQHERIRGDSDMSAFGCLDSENHIHVGEKTEFDSGIHRNRTKDVLADQMDKYKEQAERILEEAQKSADSLLLDAHNNVKQIHDDAYQAGKREGYSAGEVEARENIRLMEEELMRKMDEQDVEYAALLEEIEPKYVDVLIALVQKLTGVILEEQRDTLLFLIKQSMGNLDKSSKYVIRISKEDAHLIEASKEEIKQIIGEDSTVEYCEENNLKKNECIIETDTQMVDCGFQTQLTNLIETLKFLVS